MKLSILLLALVLHGCGAGVSTVTTLRCPAAPPSEPVCSACPPWPTDEQPAQIEALQRAYLKGQAMHNECAVATHCRDRRESVWRESWEACGDTE